MSKKQISEIVKILKKFNDNLLLILVLLGLLSTAGLIIVIVHYIITHYV
jgi:hypothetical protein